MKSSPGGIVRRALVAGHGDFAAGMISAVQQISGKGACFRGLSNRDLGAEGLEQATREAVDEEQARVIFTDLPAGSCTIAARRVARDRAGLVVVTGANLSVLLAWALREDDGVSACERAVERGRGAMAVLQGAAAPEGGGAD